MARHRSRASVTLGFILLGVLLAGVLVVADRALVHLADKRVSSQLRNELNSPDAPTVEIEHFPFLTQLIGGSFSSVHIVADDIPAANAQSTELAHVDLRLHGVTTPDRFQTFTAQQVDGLATLDYSAVKSLVGYPVSYQPDGRIRITTPSSAAVPLSATVTGTPTVNVADQTLTLTNATVSVGGLEIPAPTSQALLGSLVKPAPLTGIPYGLSVGSVTATPEGLVAALAGRNVSFSR